MNNGELRAGITADLLESSLGPKSGVYDVFRLLKSVGAMVGAPFFSVFNIPLQGGQSLFDAAPLSNWPPELVLEYDRCGLFDKSPNMIRLRITTEPFQWEVETLYANFPPKERDQLLEVCRTFGTEWGVHFPVHSADGKRGAVSFCGPTKSRTDLDSNDIAILAMLCQRCYSHIQSSSDAATDTKPKHSITPREAECLKWTAMGKTSYEIGRILEISDHTVDNHLASSAKKLNADNRTHAVWLAIQKNIIS